MAPTEPIVVEEQAVADEHGQHDSERIIDTPITWAMVEEDFQRAFNTKAKTGEKRSAKMIGDGRGFISKITLVEFDWSEDVERLPAKLVLKITTCDKLKEFCEKVAQINFDSMKGMAGRVHDAEFNFYQKAHANPEFVRDMKVPKYYCGRDFDFEGIEAGYFAMEHFENFAHRHFYHTVQESGAIDVIDVLAKLAAFSLKNPEIVDAMDTHWMDELMSEWVNQTKIEQGLDQITAKYPERSHQVEVMKKMLPIYETPEIYKQKLEHFSAHKILCHGDMWPGNMIWDKNEQGEYHVRNFIDWQVVHISSGVEDLMRILTSAVTADNYRNKRDFYIQHYYDTLKKHSDGVKLPWDNVEQLIEDYEKFFPIMVCVWFPMFLSFEEMLFRTCDESEKEECLKCFYDKLFCSIDEAEKLVNKWY
ncbi:unnamed protein product, partial [Mesorhabditis belari]|uniref:CHK kinase-like domain-containing protein n=1 Tax=Mesorhabditis belari TaxID=2138241 RepID=A0AAF3F8D0_9BILA